MRQPFYFLSATVLCAILCSAPSARAYEGHAVVASDTGCGEPAMTVAQANTISEQENFAGAPPDQEIKERGLPGAAPGTRGMTPFATTQDLEGAFFDGNTLRAKPGYSIQRLPGNTLAFRKPGGGETTYDVTCNCSRKGICQIRYEEHSVWCLRGTCSGGGASGGCKMTIRPGGTVAH